MTTVPDDGLALPPIRTNSPITVQPSLNTRDETQSSQSRASSMYLDWISASRSQLSVFSGTYFLSSVDQLEIQQVIDLSSLLGVSRKGAQYRVKVPRAETIFLAIEDSQTCQRNFLKSSRQLTLNVMDPSGETAFVIKKSLSWGCVPAFLHVRK
ncbi:hypothetical protein QAD02_022999 [Eretmocerus hayati]|uniref:Uncharacterized protein n=1 Tax=Eretmocerus hayati TaxID=131215 RepID=A0ACC2PUC8_9HYME|nr:hypothetical protein QAD02_022999 [Eretmocerus hayati]